MRLRERWSQRKNVGWQCFRENVNNLSTCRTIAIPKGFVSDKLTYVVTIDLDVVCFGTDNRIIDHEDSGFAISDDDESQSFQ